MVGLTDLARGIEFLQLNTVYQFNELFRTHTSPHCSPPKPLRLKASSESQDILRIQVVGIKNMMVNGGKAPEISARLRLVGDHDWYCEGKTQEQELDMETGNCTWNECIEFSRVHDYTSLKIKVGCCKRFGRFKVLGSTVLRLSTIEKLDKPHWFILHKDKKRKHKRGAIKLSFEKPNATKSASSEDQQELNEMKTACSDYLLKLITDLRAQVNERDQRLKLMQTYIDQLLSRILETCPQVLENK